MKKRYRWVIAIVMLVAIALVVLDMLRDGGAFRDIEPHGAAICDPVGGISGGEDIQWRANGREVFIAAQDRRALDETGHIYLLEPRAADATPRDVTPELDFEFHPHGLSLWQADDGGEKLFVVNHRGGWAAPHTVEIFDVDADGGLTHTHSIADEALISPNDLVAVGPEQFYATNDHASSSRMWHVFEDFLRLPLGNIVFFDGSKAREVYSGTRYANGINISRDGRRLYVAQTTGRSLDIFERDPQTHQLRLEQTLDLETGVDNIDVAEDGALWVAAHPNMLAFLSHMRDGDNRSPSQVLRLHEEEGRWRHEEVYLDDGEPISGSAVAAAHRNTFVIGPVFDDHVLVCVSGE